MKGKKLIILSIFLALLAALSVYRYLGDLEKSTKAAANLTTVVVAREDIPARTKLDENMFTIVEVPKNFRHTDAVLETSEVKGAFAAERLIAGEQVLSTRLVYNNNNRTALSYNVSAGHRAMTFPVGTVSGVAGYILPGDCVDVVLTMDVPEGERATTVTNIVATNIKVLATGSFTFDQGKQQLVVDSVTLDVPVEQVNKLVQASDRGSVRLVLRPNAEESNKTAPPHYLRQFLPAGN